MDHPEIKLNLRIDVETFCDLSMGQREMAFSWM